MADMIRSTREFTGDVQEEMRKVTWPDWPQLKNSTFVIVVFMVVLSLVIFVMDFATNAVLESVRGLFGA